MRVELRHAGLAAIRRLHLDAAFCLGEPSEERVARQRGLGERGVLRSELERERRPVKDAAAGVELDLLVDVNHLAVHDEDAVVEFGEGKDVYAGLALEHVIVHVLERDGLARRGGERHLRDLVGGDDEPHEEVPRRSFRLRRHDEPERPAVRGDVHAGHGAVGQHDHPRGLEAGFAVLRFA